MNNSKRVAAKRERLVYLYMFDHADADGFLTTSGAVIGKALGMNEWSVMDYLARLESRGEIFRIGMESNRLKRFAVTAKVQSSE